MSALVDVLLAGEARKVTPRAERFFGRPVEPCGAARGLDARRPMLDAAGDGAKSSAVQHNLRTLRQQIEMYKVEHGGKPPVLFKGDFPQLVYSTNSEGIPGPRGPMHPFGPYLPGGVPVNPHSGSSVVALTESFPPTAHTGTVGWLYHQESGRIAPDLPERVEATDEETD